MSGLSIQHISGILAQEDLILRGTAPPLPPCKDSNQSLGQCLDLD